MVKKGLIAIIVLCTILLIILIILFSIGGKWRKVWKPIPGLSGRAFADRIVATLKGDMGKAAYIAGFITPRAHSEGRKLTRDEANGVCSVLCDSNGSDDCDCETKKAKAFPLF